MAWTQSLRCPSSSAAVASRAKSSALRSSGSEWESVSYDAAHSRRSYASRARARSSIRPMTCPSRVDHSPPASVPDGDLLGDVRRHRGRRPARSSRRTRTGSSARRSRAREHLLDDAAVLHRPAVARRRSAARPSRSRCWKPVHQTTLATSTTWPSSSVRPPVAGAREASLGPGHAAGVQVGQFDPQAGPAMEADLVHLLAAHRGPAGEHVLEHQQDARIDQPRRCRDSEPNTAAPRGRGRRGSSGGSAPRSKATSLPGVRRAHDQHRAGREAGTAAGRHWSGAGRCRDRGRPPRPARTECDRSVPVAITTWSQCDRADRVRTQRREVAAVRGGHQPFHPGAHPHRQVPAQARSARGSRRPRPCPGSATGRPAGNGKPGSPSYLAGV